MTASELRGPLSGARVLDITRSVAGPWTTRLLCDAGAEVIKIEPPPYGDFIRALPVQIGKNVSGFFLQGNSGKKSVGLDIKHPAGREAVQRLIRASDVLVQNMRPRAAERCALTYEQVSAFNPDIIMCSISGYGLQTPLVNKPGQDIGVQCLTGLSGLTGLRDGPPAIPLWSVADTVTALHAYTAICAALVARAQGRGPVHIDLAMSRSAVQLHDVGFAVEGLHPALVGSPARNGRYHPFLLVRGVLAARDGYVGLSAFRNRDWVKLAPLLGEEFCDPRYLDHTQRLKDRQKITSTLDAISAQRTAVELVELLKTHGLRAFSLSPEIESVTSNPRLVARRSLAPVDPTPGSALLGNSATVRAIGAANLLKGAPKVGQHTLEILGGLAGYSRDELLQMYIEGVLAFDDEVVGEFLAGVQGG